MASLAALLGDANRQDFELVDEPARSTHRPGTSTVSSGRPCRTGPSSRRSNSNRGPPRNSMWPRRTSPCPTFGRRGWSAARPGATRFFPRGTARSASTSRSRFSTVSFSVRAPRRRTSSPGGPPAAARPAKYRRPGRPHELARRRRGLRADGRLAAAPGAGEPRAQPRADPLRSGALLDRRAFPGAFQQTRAEIDDTEARYRIGWRRRRCGSRRRPRDASRRASATRCRTHGDRQVHPHRAAVQRRRPVAPCSDGPLGRGVQERVGGLQDPDLLDLARAVMMASRITVPSM